MIRLLAAVLLAFGLALPVLAEDFTRYALTVPMVQKVQSAGNEIKKKVGKKYKEGQSEGDMDAAKFEKFIDTVPEAKPILAKYGLSTRDFAFASFAMMEAGLHLMLSMDPAADKKQAAALLATYPPETRANIELLRNHPELMQRK